MAEDKIRMIDMYVIECAVAEALKEANLALPDDVVDALKKAEAKESSPLAKRAFEYMLKNLEVARTSQLPVCQDTGVVSVIAKVGRLVHIENGSLIEAITNGVKTAYLKNYFRCSVVKDPLYFRQNTKDNTPAVIHIDYVEGDKVELYCMPKGFGSENMSCLKMFSPSASPEDIVQYVVDAVRNAGANPCPPVVLGVGIGGTFDSVAMLAKEALFRPVGSVHSIPQYAELEDKILMAVNQTGIGAQGFGGDTTALGVHINVAPTHVAGLPVAVCFSCYATRRVKILI